MQEGGDLDEFGLLTEDGREPACASGNTLGVGPASRQFVGEQPSSDPFRFLHSSHPQKRTTGQAYHAPVGTACPLDQTASKLVT